MWKLILLAVLANSFLISRGTGPGCNDIECGSNQGNYNQNYNYDNNSNDDDDSDESDSDENDSDEDDCVENDSQDGDSKGYPQYGRGECPNALARFNKALLRTSTNMLKVYSDMHPGETFCISPLIIIYLVAGIGFNTLGQTTAEGQTQREIYRLLDVDNNNQIECILGTINYRLNNLPKGVVYYRATDYFADKKYPFTPEWSEERLVGIARNYNFNKPGQTEACINHRIASKTNNKVTDVIDDRSIFNSSAEMITISASYFMSLWDIEFQISKTVTEFRVSPDCTVPAKFYQQTDIYNYTHSSELNSKVIQLNFKESIFKSIVILPDKPFTEDIVLKKMAKNPTGWLYNVQKQFQPTKCVVNIPAYKKDTLFDSRALSIATLGIGSLYSKETIQVKGIFKGDKNAGVSAARQRNSIIVNPYGARASYVSKGKKTKTFTSNHPSIFVVLLDVDGQDTVVYVGMVKQPTEGQFHR